MRGVTLPGPSKEGKRNHQLPAIYCHAATSDQQSKPQINQNVIINKTRVSVQNNNGITIHKNNFIFLEIDG